jgi:hypothetical protein
MIINPCTEKVSGPLFRGTVALAPLATASKTSSLPWILIGVAVVGVPLLILIIWLSRCAMRRCIFCRKVCHPLNRLDSFKADPILKPIENYEKRPVPKSNVMVCDGCQTVFNCSPRSHATLGAMRLDRESAIDAGVILQVDDFGCHTCGEQLVFFDSYSLNDSDKACIEDVLGRVSPVSKPEMCLFCKECQTVHVWIPLADSGYRFLAAVPSSS